MNAAETRFALGVHGGAGTISRDDDTAFRTARYHEGLRRALVTGRDILAAGGSALDAATTAVVALEDDPLFNAGRGGVFTAAGTQEMDASVMDGTDHRAGGVAGILGPRNPVLAARAVMERSNHVLLIGEGAPFAVSKALSLPSPAIFSAISAGGNCRTSSKGAAADVPKLPTRSTGTALWVPSLGIAAAISPRLPRPVE
jgi:L-asparaginase / beta-aspartyl-peptidase